MKTTTSNKKLVLNKKNVSRLDDGELNKVKAGALQFVGGYPWVGGYPYVDGSPWIDGSPWLEASPWVNSSPW